MKVPSFTGRRRSVPAVGLVLGVAAAGAVAFGVTDPASAQSGRRICGSVWTAPSLSDPSHLYVYVRYAKVKLNSPGCGQAHRALDHNQFAAEYPGKDEKIGADIGKWTRHSFRATCEDFSTTTLLRPGTDICTELKPWNNNPFAHNQTYYSSFWTGPDADWHGAR